jgi:hypothetical protein
MNDYFRTLIMPVKARFGYEHSDYFLAQNPIPLTSWEDEGT